MPEGENKATKSMSKRAAEKVFAAFNRADELGGELRDYVQDKVVTDPRYIAARKRLAKLFGRAYESRLEVAQQAKAKADKTAAVAATASGKKAAKGLGDPSIKAQIYGKKSCPWTGRAITLFEKRKVDFDFIDLEEP